MTEFIIGKACCDPSAKLRGRLTDCILNGGNALLIVPDQFEFECEKALYRACAGSGRPDLFSNISVRTFSKLSDELIAKYSGEKKPADDVTKNIIMYRAVSEIHDQLKAFGKIALKPGFAPKMTSTIAMLKTSGISAGSFSDTVNAVKEDFRDSCPALFSKLCDISNIYSAYDALLTASFSDKLDSTATATHLAAEHGAFSGATVFVDGFSDFSRSQLEFLYTVIDTAKDVTLAFVSDNTDGCRSIFTTVNQTVSLLADHSRRADIPVKGDDTTLTDNVRFRSSALEAVSDGVFGGSASLLTDGGVRVIRADDIYSEADFIATEIRRLTDEEGLLYRDIAVLSTAPSEYRTPLESAFEKYDIPVFSDTPETILHMPLVNLVLTLLNVLKSFTVDNLLSYIKTGFIQKSSGKPLTMRDINAFEDYIYTWDLKSSDLKQPFPDEKGKAPHAEEIRADIVPPLLELREKLKGCTGAEITKAVCDFLFDTVGVQRAVAAHCKKAGSELLTDSDKEMISSYQTLWNTLLEIFEGLYQGLDGFMISIADYCGLVHDICAQTTLALPPQVQDSVLSGDISRTRIDGARAVFICGACYGLFPNESVTTGIFSEYETELLGESIVKLGMNRRERYCYERYLAYAAMSVPSDRLYLTYPMLNISCAKMSPSDVMTELKELFGITEEDASSFGAEFYCRSLRAAQQRFAACLNDDSTEHATLKKALELSGNSAFTERIETLSRNRATAYRHSLDPETAGALFRSRTFSATKLESLNQCRFRYFCSNGLRVREKTRKDLSSMEIGNAVHYVLQRMLEEYCNSMDVFITLTRPQLAEKTRFYLNQYKAEALGGDFAKSLRFDYLFRNLTTGAVDILILLQAEFAARDYRPKFFELRIGGKEQSSISPATDQAKALDIDSILKTVLNDDADNSGTLAVTREAADISDSDGHADEPAQPSASPGSNRREISTVPLSIKLRDDLEINITGIIDRADTFTDNSGNEYIRVVDYKTGSREFSMVNLYYGINTQMLLYLIAVCDANKELRPGGVSYLPARVTEPVSKRTAAFALLAQDHIQNGMYVRNKVTDTEMMKYADNMSALSGAKPEKFIPKDENNLSEEEFQRLRSSCLSQTEDVLSKLYDGDIAAVPTVYKEKSLEKKACNFCRFEMICGHNKNAEVYALPQEKDEKAKTEVKPDELDG